MIKKFLRVLASSVVIFSAVGALGADTTKRITVTGSSTIAPLMSDVAKLNDAKRPDVRTDVQSGGTSRGITDVRNGSAQVGMVSRALYAEERDLQSLLIARDGVAMVVHRSNPVDKLTKAQVVDIYTRKIKNWKEVGGLDLPITVVSKAEGRSTLEVFTHYFGLSYRAIKAQAIVGDNQQELMTIAGNKGSIGYVSIGSAEHEQKAGVSIKLIQLDTHVPSTGAVASGEYPISRDLNLVFKQPVTAETKALLDTFSSSEGRALITKHFFVPVR